MSWEQTFVERLASVQISNVFNPYCDHCEVHDLVDAASIRRSNLEAILDLRKSTSVDSIWFGRDLGYRGGRRTGLALTDEVAMFSAAGALKAGPKIARATHGTPVAERTAAVIWSLINRLRRPPMLWNAFPFHPHEPEAPFTNRAHTTRERRLTGWAIEALIDRFDNPQLIAIGNDASKALSDLGFKHQTARHPSYGGQREFIETMERLHGLSPTLPQKAEPKLL
ncbi:uracil-DNA glycosylase [Sphingobium sp. CR2-8]|uniref:uracil-DNA glycosylase n=1 Tax=Sphingobium sp. CR2-8 TaxID=1306534 RepID=UPI002DB5BADB|nr:uracil-DNA glycosylase [Sphingobium sp. CR2-8]MEC3912593.1 uracil-DNA glycosylase [Sphingobium sp. CR2-8]